MQTIAEHADRAELTALDLPAERPPLTLYAGQTPYAYRVRMTYPASNGAERTLLEGLLRPAQYQELLAEVGTFNANPALGWRHLGEWAAQAMAQEAQALLADAQEVTARTS